jgi:hypothetical protein
VTYSKTVHRTRIRWGRVAGLLAVLALIAVALDHELTASSPSAEPSFTTAPPTIDHRGALGEAGGALPDGTSVFDDALPGVAKLDPDLLGALRRAATDAGAVRFVVDSGWRSPAYQEQLLRQAISRYGSLSAAERWVASPDTSAHVKGDAVDIGKSGAAWLSVRGAAYGLCRVYGNEPWHYELRPDAVVHGCPPMYADPTQDPRMQR